MTEIASTVVFLDANICITYAIEFFIKDHMFSDNVYHSKICCVISHISSRKDIYDINIPQFIRGEITCKLTEVFNRTFDKYNVSHVYRLKIISKGRERLRKLLQRSESLDLVIDEEIKEINRLYAELLRKGDARIAKLVQKKGSPKPSDNDIKLAAQAIKMVRQGRWAILISGDFDIHGFAEDYEKTFRLKVFSYERLPAEPSEIDKAFLDL